MRKWKPDVEFQYGGRLGNSMACHPKATQPRITLQGAAIGEFTVTIPEPHATL